MQVSDINGVKIYNLTAGKNLPEWLSNEKKRALLKKDEELGRRIDLIQDFEMPAVTNCINLTKDGNYILCAGVYKPRIRCYDVKQLSMKFERCVDAEIIKMHMLTEDYTKFICLEQDRHVEFHASSGFHYKTRIPKPGRDMDYNTMTCDVYFVGTGSEIFRLNLEQGRFLSSLQTNARIITACQFNPVHQLFTCVTTDGSIESWDPRARERVALVDCHLSEYLDGNDPFEETPGFTCLKYKDALHMGVGTNFGMILLYDIRSRKPYLVKDHMYGLPIKKIDFYTPATYGQLDSGSDMVASLDTKILKIWPEADPGSGRTNFATIEPGADLNDHVTVPGTGMMFLAAEAPKILAYFLPQLGPAPGWYPYLDTLTEELENEDYHGGGVSSVDDLFGAKSQKLVYDNYKFVTRDELEQLGLDHLVGTDMLRAYMHGYFVDSALYFRTKSLVNPFAYAEYRKTKVKEKLEAESVGEKLKIERDLPRVNTTLAKKIIQTQKISKSSDGGPVEEKKSKSRHHDPSSLFDDDRFKRIFADTNYEIDPASEEFKFINPIISRMDKKLSIKQTKMETADHNHDDSDGGNKSLSSSDDESYFFSKSTDHPDDSDEDDSTSDAADVTKDKSIAHKTSNNNFPGPQRYVHQDTETRLNLEKRIEEIQKNKITHNKSNDGRSLNKEMTFPMKKKVSRKEQNTKGKSSSTHFRRPVGDMAKKKGKRR